MVVCPVDGAVSLFDKLNGISKVFKPYFKEEWHLATNNYHLKPSILLFKLMYMDLVRALKLKKQISRIIKDKQIDVSNTVFYSYWHDYKALALSMMRTENSSLVCIARAHGWDVFFERQQPPYLPFKKHIVSTLNQTYSISEAGKNEFIELLGIKFNDKVSVSRLGKINQRIPASNKCDEKTVICTCSNIIPLKRIHLIIDLLSDLNLGNIKWFHFGEGYLRDELERYAKEKIAHIDYCFKGNVPNSEILDFYRDNNVDLFINLSESEGIPVSIMEALSAGIPVLATDVGGTAEAVNEKVGFLIPKDFEMDKVVEMVTHFIDSNTEVKQQLRNNAYNFWKDSYEANRNYGKFVDTIHKL
jgi:glycosyltransferase involved in cell wall biosynthesis